MNWNKFRIVGLLIAVVFGLVGCGGGGGSDSASNINSNTSNLADTGPLAKYAGTWMQGCSNHYRETAIITVSNNGTTLTYESKDEYFANKDCTGSVVATGTYDKPASIIQYNETVNNASVKLLTGATATTTVEKVTSNRTGAVIRYVGSGVTSSNVVGTKTITHINYIGGSIDLTVDNASGGGQGALSLLNGEMLVLDPVNYSSSSFVVLNRYIR